MVWTWWQRDELAPLDTDIRAVIAQSPSDSPSAHAAQALAHAEAGATEEALARLHFLEDIGWDNVGGRSSVTLALAAAACGGLGIRARDIALRVYEEMRPYAGTAVVIRPPAVACIGPADYYLGLLAMTVRRPGVVAGALRSGIAAGLPDAVGAVRRSGGSGAGPRRCAGATEVMKGSAWPSSCGAPRNRHSAWVCIAWRGWRPTRADAARQIVGSRSASLCSPFSRSA